MLDLLTLGLNAMERTPHESTRRKLIDGRTLMWSNQQGKLRKVYKLFLIEECYFAYCVGKIIISRTLFKDFFCGISVRKFQILFVLLGSLFQGNPYTDDLQVWGLNGKYIVYKYSTKIAAWPCTTSYHPNQTTREMTFH